MSYNCTFLEHDVLSQETEEVYSHLEDNDSSSGYGSSDSLTPPSSPTSRRKTPSTGCKVEEVMMYSNTESLSDSLQFILDMPELCDVTFLVGDAREPVHGVKAIIATRSRVFYQMILHHQRKATEKVKSKSLLRLNKSKKNSSKASSLQILIPEYDKDVFSSLISFLHSGKIRVKLSTVVGLLCAAVEFGLKDLQKACEDFVKRSIRQGHRDMLMLSVNKYFKKKGAQKLLVLLQNA